LSDEMYICQIGCHIKCQSQNVRNISIYTILYVCQIEC
jgi:hypothetical protein